ncbi:M-phase phosphoprotein 9 isoform X2 [Tiliqua scincoides]|uniref:M-phase phosphoprotein 9 isoform X2 n=1 Tax=Tiliqua scincoides TaxID=71010 RepID=UPI003461B343
MDVLSTLSWKKLDFSGLNLCFNVLLKQLCRADLPMGLHSEHELLVSQLASNETESRLQTSAIHQECLANSVSLSSGYGTCSAAELSPSKPEDIPTCMENPEGLTKVQDGALSVQVDLVPASVQNKREHTHTTVEHCPSRKGDDIAFPAEFEPKVNEGQCGKTSCKSLTSWAQKLKKSQLKRTGVEEGDAHSVQGKEQTQKLTFEDTNSTAAEPSSYTFCLSQPDGSQNSVVSDNSGLTYWKLDEKELYHSLPEKFRNEFSISSAKVSSEQSSSGDEMKPASLKDIYHKKQRENRQLLDWNLSPSQSTHPPEILTLDPTLHMKPGQQNPGLSSHSFYGTPDKACFSPDSMMEPAFSIHLDTDSFSRASSMSSPPSAGSQNDILSTTALHVDPWNSYAFQNEANTPGSSVAYVHPGNDGLNMEEEDNLTLTPSSAAHCQPLSTDIFPEYSISATCVEDPAVLSRIRQNLREKHARHIADLRAYYDSEIQSLKQQLEASHKSPSKDLKKINQTLADRCDQLETTLNDTNNRMRALENKNNTLEMEVTDWRERFCAVSNTTKALQERIEEMRTSSKEKDNTISRLKRRLKDLEEAFEKAYKLSDNKDARLKEENKMFQNLLGEYESLGKEHERVKDTLNITENKLLDAHAQISDLKRTVSKLEAQIKQLEHENGLKFRHLADFRTSYTHSSKLSSSDVSRRKWLIPGAEYSIFTGQPLEAHESPKDNRLEETYATCRHYSPPEKDSSSDPSLTNESAKKEPEASETPIIKAFKELEERKALKSWGAQAGKDEEAVVAPAKATSRRPTVGFDETALGVRRSPEKGKDHQRHKRYSSPSGQRSSSLPPSNRKSNTPTRREIMLAPVAVTYSPKRSPKENLSPGFSHLLNRNENTLTRFDILLDDLETAPAPAAQCSNPRKKLQFLSIGDAGGAKNGRMGPAWEEESSRHTNEPCLPSSGPAPCEGDFKYVSRFKTLAETEKFFDDLTHEKQQIEAQLSRIPCTGGRMSLQARLNQEALEDQLERINRELGSIRMILKRFHVLRTSANI